MGKTGKIHQYVLIFKGRCQFLHLAHQVHKECTCRSLACEGIERNPRIIKHESLYRIYI